MNSQALRAQAHTEVAITHWAGDQVLTLLEPGQGCIDVQRPGLPQWPGISGGRLGAQSVAQAQALVPSSAVASGRWPLMSHGMSMGHWH